MMRKLLFALFALVFASSAQAQNYSATAGSGLTFGSKFVSSVNYPQWVLCDPTTPAQCAAVNSSGQLSIAAASGAVASGAYASGAFAAGAFANGADPVEGTITTAHGCLVAGYTVIGCLGQIDDDVKGSIAAGSAIIGKVGIDQTTPGTTNGISPVAAALGGATPSGIVAANSNNSTNLKASAGTVYGVQTGNISASTPYYLKLYDKATAPTCGTDTPVIRILIPPSNSGNNAVFPVGKKFTTGIGFCIVTGIADNDNTSVPAATILSNVDWN